MIRITLALCLLAGCLDSLVDNPCEDGYALVDDACIADVPDAGDAAPPVADPTDNPVAPPDPPPLPPGLQPPAPPTVSDPTTPPPGPADGLSPCPTCR